MAERTLLLVSLPLWGCSYHILVFRARHAELGGRESWNLPKLCVIEIPVCVCAALNILQCFVEASLLINLGIVLMQFRR